MEKPLSIVCVKKLRNFIDNFVQIFASGFQFFLVLIITRVRLDKKRTVKAEVVETFDKRFEVENAFARQTNFARRIDIGKVGVGNFFAHFV